MAIGRRNETSCRIKLASEFNVAVGTLERALSSLLSEGILIATERSGTFVGSLDAITAAQEKNEVPTLYVLSRKTRAGPLVVTQTLE